MRRFVFALALLVASIPASSIAQWLVDGAPISFATGTQDTPSIIPDGAGGAIVTFQDSRNGVFDISAQRVSKLGVQQWTANGAMLCAAASTQFSPVLESDGAGGAIVAWWDNRSGGADIYVQRVSALGVPLWTANGVALCTAANEQYYPRIAVDGAGGAMVTWFDYRTGTADIYAQRVNASGVPQWAANGVALCTAVSDQTFPTIAPDGAGGALIAWSDYRTGTADVYMQRVNASGVPQWTANGVGLCTAVNDQGSGVIVSDGAGGAVVAWIDLRGGSNYDVYAQRVNPSGVSQWTVNGVVLCAAANDQAELAIVGDGASGAIVSWSDLRGGISNDIYAQRIGGSGVVQWVTNGVALGVAANNQFGSTIATDGAGGAIVVWADYRSGSFFDIYSQRVSATGVPQWTPNGIAISPYSGNEVIPVAATNGAGGVVVAWQDDRNGFGTDIYAQLIEGRYGFWGHPEPVLDTVMDVPGDQGGKVKVNWYAAGRDALNQQVISHYTVWRATDSSVVPVDAVVNLSDVGRDFSGPAYRVERTPTADYFWELVATQDAIYLPSYAYTASTTYDSTAIGAATHQFQVVSHAYYNQYINWPSNVVAGHSVDNLAPAAPFLLTAQRVGADVQLQWNRAVAPDLRDYALYRATSSGVTPVPINFLVSAEDTLAVDANAPSSALYYIVTAYDVHANEGPPSNEASVGALTGIGQTPAITSLTVLQNHPNPFQATTNFEIGLPGASRVSIEVFDVAGRRVAAMEVTGAGGWQRIPFAGRDERGRSLASGVYFARVTAAGATVTKKMVIAR